MLWDRSDLNMTILYSSCLYQRGQPNCEEDIWDGHSERAFVYGSLPGKNSHIKGPVARSEYLIIIGSQPEHQGKSLNQRHQETQTCWERSSWNVGNDYMFIRLCVRYWLALLVDTMPSVLVMSAAFWHRLGTDRTCWLKGWRIRSPSYWIPPGTEGFSSRFFLIHGFKDMISVYF